MSSSNTDFDTKLVDWLYGELDSDGLASFEAHLEAHPEHKAEAHALRDTRVAFQGLEEAEPPGALTTMLMQQAAAEVQPKAGVWSAVMAFFQPVLLHPAASAMATVILLAGVAGTLYLRNEKMVADPSAAHSAAESPVAMGDQPTSAPGAAPAKSLERETASADLDEMAPSPAVQSADEGYKADLATPAQEQSLRAAIAADGLLGGAGDKTRNVAAEPQDADDFVYAADKTRNVAAEPQDADDFVYAADMATNAISGGGGARGAETRGLADTKSKLSLRDAESTSGPARPNARRQPASTPPAPKTSKSKDASTWEQQQVVSFQAAARTKRCRDAGRIANDLREKNPKVYEKNVKGSPEESDCSYYIASETKRRSRAKSAKRALTKSKKSKRKGQGKSVPNKAIAAPEQDEFEEADVGDSSPAL